MRAGRLRHRLSVERYTTTQDDWGDEVQAWESIATVWGSVEPLRGNERHRAMQVQATEEVRVLMRWQPDIADLNASDRIVFGSKVYDISAVLNIDERNREVHVMAREHGSVL